MTRQDEQYVRYAQDSSTLASIGRALDGPVAPGVTLPEPLRRAAVDAWERDEDDPVPAVETDGQRRSREDAGVLALIGLTVLRSEQSGGELVLAPDLVAGAVRAAQRRRG